MAIALCWFVLRLAAAELPTESQIYAAVVADVERTAESKPDGMINRAEYARVGAITPLDAIDADGNGAIDAAELASYTERTPITLRVGTIFAGPRTIPTGSPPSGRGWRLAGVALAVAVVAVGIGALSGRRSGRRRRGRG
jgi:hypothetical protein